MKISYNGNEYELEGFAASRDETEMLKRMGDINYINYLRVYKSMEIWIVYDVHPLCKSCKRYLKTCEGIASSKEKEVKSYD